MKPYRGGAGNASGPKLVQNNAESSAQSLIRADFQGKFVTGKSIEGETWKDEYLGRSHF